MSRRRVHSGILFSILLLAFSLCVLPSAHAEVIWDGAASNGTGVFGHIGSNCSSPGSFAAAEDPTYGTVWRYDKPAGLDRCESRGITVGDSQFEYQEGETYYFGWRSKLSDPVDNNATFQWKSYGDHTQNWPMVLKVVDGEYLMLQRQPGNEIHEPWSSSVPPDDWNHFVLAIHVSSELDGGWIELWSNGTKQTFTNGSDRWDCRTLDDENHPKWGVYGATGDSVVNLVHGLKMGTSYDDVAG